MAKKTNKKTVKAVWGWVQETPKPTATSALKVTVEASFLPTLQKLRETHVLPENEENDALYEKYPVDIYFKWHRHFLYLCVKYKHLHPQAIAPYYEDRFVRIECHDSATFTLYYFRHTGQWHICFYNNVNAEEAEKAILEDPFFEVFGAMKRSI
jgi:hypothetical protein